jgi:polysaccharide deacetylase family protein (PEP-CTERM system associated)
LSWGAPPVGAAATGAGAVDGPRHAFTVDVEEWCDGMELGPSFTPPASRLRVGLDRLLRLLDTHSTKATFFVLGRVAAAHPGLVTELEQSGHEVACHGFDHQFIYRRTPADFAADVRRALDVIGSELGHPISGFRAPFFSICKSSLWAFDVLAQLGIRYDSSVFPVHHDRYGLPGSPRAPYPVTTPYGTVTEIPLTPARVLGLNVPFSGGAYMRFLPWLALQALWERATAAGAVVAYVHPWELDEHQPHVAASRRVRLSHYHRLDATAVTLDRLLAKYRFGRVDEILAMWSPTAS